MQLFFLLFVHLGQVAMVTAVSGCRDGRDTDDQLLKDCKAAGLSDVPAGWDPKTQVLLFPSNRFSSLSWSSFQPFTQIHELDFSENQIPQVAPAESPLLPTLSVLRLGSNRLTSLSDRSFSACPALTELYLNNNTIQSLSDHTFSGLSKLEILDLSSNHIKELPGSMMHPLPTIHTLFINQNQIKLLPNDWFSTKEEVPYLFFSDNPWDCTCPNLYLTTYIIEFDSNFYIQTGSIRDPGVLNVVCSSPPRHAGTPVMNLKETDLCPPAVTPPTSPAVTPPTSPAVTPPTSPAVTPPTSPELPVLETELSFEYMEVESWNQTFISFTEWSEESGSVVRSDVTSVGLDAMTSHPTLTTTTRLTRPAETTTHVPSTLTSTTLKENVQVTTTTMTTSAPTNAPTNAMTNAPTNAMTNAPTNAMTNAPTNAMTNAPTNAMTNAPTNAMTNAPTNAMNNAPTNAPTNAMTNAPTNAMTNAMTNAPTNAMNNAPTNALTNTPIKAPTSATINAMTNASPSWAKVSANRGARFCFWLLAGCVLLCVASAGCTLVTVLRLVVWYRRSYKPLTVMLAARRRSEGLRLLTNQKGKMRMMTSYRSVLYVSREEGDATEREEESAQEGQGGKVITLKPTGGGATREEEGRGVYRKTLYRQISKEEEMEGWRDGGEEDQVSAEDGGRSGGARDEGVSRERTRKRYSLILREQREEAGGGREEQDWVVGGWEEPRSSWGEWLEQYLPRLPRVITTPSGGEVAE